MDILNDLTRCNFYYYILRSNKAYLIFKYLQLIGNDICLEDALVRKQQIKLENKIIRILNKDIKTQYKVLQDLKQLQSDQNTNFDDELYSSIVNDHLLVIQYLFNSRSNYFSLRKYDQSDIYSDDNGVLLMAARKGHLAIVQYLVSIGGNIHGQSNKVLSVAAGNGHLTIVQYLVSIGGNIESAAPLIWAASKGHLSVVKYLFNLKFNIFYNKTYEKINIRTFNDALSWAAHYNHLDVVQYLLQPYELNNFLNSKFAVNINVRDNNVLIWATKNGHLDVIQYLFSIGADIHTDNDIILRIAAYKDNLQILQYLVSKGSNIHGYKSQALKYAARNGKLRIVQYLVSIGANTNNLTLL